MIMRAEEVEASGAAGLAETCGRAQLAATTTTGPGTSTRERHHAYPRARGASLDSHWQMVRHQPLSGLRVGRRGGLRIAGDGGGNTSLVDLATPATTWHLVFRPRYRPMRFRRLDIEGWSLGSVCRFKKRQEGSSKPLFHS